MPPATFSRLLYGGDYNPEQWLDMPGIWDEDMRLMRLAHVNTVSLGIFAWASLEPEEGRYTFDWLDAILEQLHASGVRVNLATPSGSKPHWMAQKYPEIRRVQPNGLREPQQGRHNHCLTSPVYREKVRAINTELALRYKDHPALQLWHISNEYGGYCYCDLCKAAFREWLKQRYNNDLDALNRAYWSKFWSHTYLTWEQIDAIDHSVHGLALDWKRFMTDQCIDFIENEIAPLREHTPDIPVTTNFMGTYDAYDYWKMARHLDVVCWDSYPDWHTPNRSDAQIGTELGFIHDIYRAMKQGQPWLLMETTPSAVNWKPVSRPRRPGANRLNGLQAVAHGGDAVLYFQWRKSRGSSEKFHGAVVDHVGHENTRVFRESAALGEELEQLSAIAGARTTAEVALIYDWENDWAIKGAQAQRNQGQEYQGTCVAHYAPFWKRGIPVDVIDSLEDFTPYKLLIAPMLYMLRPGVAERIAAFVEAGGTLITTYLTGITDESDLCFLGGFPGPLRPVLGVWAEETDVFHEGQTQSVRTSAAAEETLGLLGVYEAHHYADIIHPEGDSVEVLATYRNDFYAGSPALTVNTYGAGRAYYIASRNDDRFTDDLLGGLIRSLDLRRSLGEVSLPHGVTARHRTSPDGAREWVFLLNFNKQEAPVDLSRAGVAYKDARTGEPISDVVALPPYGALVLERSDMA